MAGWGSAVGYWRSRWRRFDAYEAHLYAA